jgi:hypothetical protein
MMNLIKIENKYNPYKILYNYRRHHQQKKYNKLIKLLDKTIDGLENKLKSSKSPKDIINIEKRIKKKHWKNKIDFKNEINYITMN